MKRLLNLISFVPFIAFAQFEGSKQVFKSPNLPTATASHKTIAILPSDVLITYRKQPKNFNPEADREQEIKMSTSIQGSLYTYLLRHSNEYPISIQTVDETILRLKRVGMEGNLDKFTKTEIATALGVDAVLSSKFEMRQTQSDGLAIATMVLVSGAGGRTGIGKFTLNLNNGTDGELLWRFYKSMDENVIACSTDLIERMMRKVARNFPYRIID
ncbi:MAG TPA: hypothetical protein VGE44_03395 [Daejeonella sp.]|uniref:hypothetical protein n=1 Tax=Daejeonella sp. TaxID=2805397 RepID=UPI002ED8C517